MIGRLSGLRRPKPRGDVAEQSRAPLFRLGEFPLLYIRPLAYFGYQEMGLKRAERPTITKSNIVCAEPMPGEAKLLEDFAYHRRQKALVVCPASLKLNWVRETERWLPHSTTADVSSRL